MALFGHGIGEFLFMVYLGHVSSLKSKRKSNCNYMKIETKLKWKYYLKKFFQAKSLIYLRPFSDMALVKVFLWSVSAT